jgi:hypothetical protein
MPRLYGETLTEGVSDRVRTLPGMISFGALEDAAPAIAGPVRDKFETTGIALLGTLRADGSPRVSPIEVFVRDGLLYVGMMPGSQKSRDVRRDPRCALLTAVADKDDLSGEGKLFAIAREITDAGEVAALLSSAMEGRETDPAELDGSPVFEMLVTGAAWQHVDGDGWVSVVWSPERGVRTVRRDGATGEPHEVG